MLVDTHTHLDDKKLASDLDFVLSKMAENDVGFVVNNACNSESIESTVALATRVSNIYAAVGIHPHTATEYNDAVRARIEELSSNPKVVAIGEIGLDYYYNFCTKEEQKSTFVAQLELAHRLGLPVVLHIRDAYGDALQVLRENKDILNNGVLLHCYSGSAELVRDFGEFDSYFAFGGAVTFAKHKDLVLKAVPRDRLLMETDCPYMTPIPMRGKLNYPHNVTLVRDAIARLLDTTAQEIEDITTENARRFFRIHEAI